MGYGVKKIPILLFPAKPYRQRVQGENGVPSVVAQDTLSSSIEELKRPVVFIVH